MIDFKSDRCAGCGGKLIPIAKGDPPEGTKFRRAIGIIFEDGDTSSAYLCLGQGGKPEPACQKLLEVKLNDHGARVGIKTRGEHISTEGSPYHQKPRCERVTTWQDAH